jgi:hypothetical protein
MRYTYEKYNPEEERKHIREHAPHQTGVLLFSDPGYLVYDSLSGLTPNSAIAYCRNSFDAASIVAALSCADERKK